MVHVEASVLACEQVVERHDAEEREYCRRNHDVEHELQKVLHVALAHTVVDPGAVMVHFENTEVALAAVMSPSRLPSFFTNTLCAVLDLIVLTLERWSEALRDPAWVGKCTSEVTDVGQEAEAIESNGVKKAFKCERNALDELLVNHLF